MSTQKQFQSLGRIAFVMTKWITLKQWARRNGFTDTAENAEKWIEDCKARGQRINNLTKPELKNSKSVLAVSEFGLQPVGSK